VTLWLVKDKNEPITDWKSRGRFLKMGHPAAEVACFSGVTASAVVRAAKTEELKEVQKYL